MSCSAWNMGMLAAALVACGGDEAAGAGAGGGTTGSTTTGDATNSGASSGASSSTATGTGGTGGAAAASSASTGSAGGEHTYEPYTFKAISHNICGGPCNKGSLAALTTIKGAIDAWLPDFVGLQEVCENQYRELVRTYDDAGWDLRFVSLRWSGPTEVAGSVPQAHPDCTTVDPLDPDPPAAYPQGQVLMVRGAMTAYDVEDLPHNDGNKFFTLQCGEFARAGVAKTIRACNTHLRVGTTDTANLDYKLAQLQTIEVLTDPHVAAKVVSITGDLNIRPSHAHMDNIYRLTLSGSHVGDGEFREADQLGGGGSCPGTSCRDMEVTTDGSLKIDYAFFNRQSCDNATLSGGVIPSSTSDHHIKRGRCDVL